MAGALDTAANVAVLVFVVGCMAAAGLGLSPSDIIAPLRRLRLVALALAANFIVAPVLALGLTEIVPMDRPYAVGLLLLGGAAGAPFLPKLAAAADGDIGFSVGLMLLLTVGSVGFMPVVLPVLIPGLAAEPWPILRPLLLTMLLPLAVGVAVRRHAEPLAVRLKRAAGVVSNVGMVVALALLIGLNGRAMLGTFGSGAVAAAVGFVVASFGVGYALGGPDPRTRSVLGLGTGQRNVAAALVVGTRNFDAPGVVAMLLVSTILGVVILLILARFVAPLGSAGSTEGAVDAGEPSRGVPRTTAGEPAVVTPDSPSGSPHLLVSGFDRTRIRHEFDATGFWDAVADDPFSCGDRTAAVGGSMSIKANFYPVPSARDVAAEVE